MDIQVACASSLFKENGHDLKGIFNLFYNAVYAYVSVAVVDMHKMRDSDYSVNQISDNREFVSHLIGEVLENFSPNKESAASRIAQFDQEYQELKKLGKKIKEVSFWTVLTRSNKQINAYIKRRKEIENETISLEELLNVAYYKFLQVNGTFKQFKNGFFHFLEIK